MISIKDHPTMLAVTYGINYQPTFRTKRVKVALELKYESSNEPKIYLGNPLFHHQTSTCIEKVMFWEVNVDLLPGTSSGK